MRHQRHLMILALVFGWGTMDGFVEQAAASVGGKKYNVQVISNFDFTHPSPIQVEFQLPNVFASPSYSATTGNGTWTEQSGTSPISFWNASAFDSKVIQTYLAYEEYSLSVQGIQVGRQIWGVGVYSDLIYWGVFPIPTGSRQFLIYNGTETP